MAVNGHFRIFWGLLQFENRMGVGFDWHLVTNDAVAVVARFGKMTFLKLSNSELEWHLKNLVSRERNLMHQILEHLCEIDRRKLYLEKAYSSLFEYLVKDLGYSSSAAQRRVEAVRLARDIPALTDKIESGVLNLSQIGELSRAVKQKERESGKFISAEIKQQLATAIENLDTSNTQKVLSQLLDLNLKPCEIKRVQKDESVHLQITLSKEQFAKLNECRDLAAATLEQNNLGMSLAEVIEVLADQFIRSKKSIAAPATGRVTVSSKTEFKSVTPKLRKKILWEQKHCQYRDPKTNRICGSTFQLEVDHQHPQWAGGKHIKKNLRVLCAAHNKYIYQKQSGFF